MRIKTEALKKALAILSRVTTKDVGVLAQIDNNTLTLYANNGELKIVKKLEVMEGENKEFVLDETAIKIINSLPEGEAVFKFGDLGKISIKVCRVNNTIILPANNIIVEKDETILSQFIVDKDVLSRISEAAYACSQEDQRPILQGVKFDCEIGKIVALDGYRVVTQLVPEIISKDSKNSVNFVIKGDKITNFKYLEGEIQVFNRNRWVEFVSESQQLFISIAKLEGQYADITPIEASKGDKVGIFSTAELIGAFARLKIACPENLTVISIKNKTATVATGNKNVKMEQVLDTATIEFDDELQIVFNTTYLLECMQSYRNCDSVKLIFDTNKNPMVVEVEGGRSFILPIVRAE